MKKCWRIFGGVFGFVLLLMGSAQGKAAEQPQVGQVVIESMGPASGTMPKGKLAAIVNYIHADKHTWYKNGSRHEARYPGKGTQRNRHDRVVLKMRYGIGDGYDVRFAMPVVMNNFRAGSTLSNGAASKNGIGDTTFVLHKQFISQQEGAPVSVAWDLGIWTPTGDTSSTGVGTGAWGVMGGLGVGHAFDGGRQFLEGEVMYLYRGVGHSSRVDVSDIFRLNGALYICLESLLGHGNRNAVRIQHRIQTIRTRQWRRQYHMVCRSFGHAETSRVRCFAWRKRPVQHVSGL